MLNQTFLVNQGINALILALILNLKLKIQSLYNKILTMCLCVPVVGCSGSWLGYSDVRPLNYTVNTERTSGRPKVAWGCTIRIHRAEAEVDAIGE